jgi:hypothetical protein
MAVLLRGLKVRIMVKPCCRPESRVNAAMAPCEIDGATLVLLVTLNCGPYPLELEVICSRS